MAKKKAHLPPWAKALKNGRIEIDPDGFYPALLAELGADPDSPTQYWLEVAYQCAKLDVQAAVAGSDLAAPAGGALVILMLNRPKWKIADAPDPDAKSGTPGIVKATKGKEARAHYRRIRPSVI